MFYWLAAMNPDENNLTPSEPLAPIPTTFRRYLRELSVEIAPILVFGFILSLTILLWTRSRPVALPSSDESVELQLMEALAGPAGIDEIKPGEIFQESAGGFSRP